MLAGISEQLVIYKFHNTNLTKIQEFKDNELEIISFSWSSDNNKIIYSTQDSLLIMRNITNNTLLFKIEQPNKVVSVIFDPLDRYIGSL